MLDEGSGAMEKKNIGRQPPSSGQCRNGANSVERKSDFVPSKHGRGRRQGSFTSNKVPDGQAPRPVPIQKLDRPMGDRRQRQRVGYDYRQREEVVESGDVFDVLTTGSRKGNANHLLNFKFQPRQNDDHRWYSRPYFKSHSGGGSRKAKRYKKEQFLQACCQFVVRDTGDYTEQAISCDTLVDWSMIELVRSFSLEPVHCPICLQYPKAGKITKCGHTYCWACVLHYLKLGQDEARKCPICYEIIEADELKSVEWIDVPSFKIGDEISLRLMRKAKGSVVALPKEQWKDMQGSHMNIEDGPNTKYMKLLVASLQQVRDVIMKERDELMTQLVDAEDSEVCFIQMALDCLTAKDSSLEKIFCEKTEPKNAVYIPGLGSVETCKTESVSIDKNCCTNSAVATYADAFEDEIVEITEEAKNILCDDDVSLSLNETDRQRNDSLGSLPFGSPPCPFPLIPDQEVNPVPLSLEETSDHLELPINVSPIYTQTSKHVPVLNTSDTYYFYQAATGQHIYMNSLNAQCLAKEYGSLENSPHTVNASIVAIERIFMTEDVRKRLRYLDHIPLTSEIHVVELNIKPPTITRQTLKYFEGAFSKKRKQRQQKEREDKRRAKKFEIEQKKSFGIYPEVELPLDNVYQFPAPLSVQDDLEDIIKPVVTESVNVEGERGNQYLGINRLSDMPTNKHRSRHDSTTSNESMNGSMSFAEMLRAGRTTSTPTGAWGRSSSSSHNFPSLVGPIPPTRHPSKCNDDSDGESLPAPNYSDSMSDAIAKALDGIALQKQSDDVASSKSTSNSGGRKKRKGKKILFSTSMARDRN